MTSDMQSRTGTAADHSRTTLIKTCCILALFMGIALIVSGLAAAPANKCVVSGTVTYQQAPCASSEVRKPPTLQELNAEEKRKRAAALTAAPAKVASDAPTSSATPATPTRLLAPKVASAFRCDARKHCSQMTSCAEAKFFLANCPGVKMDGDRDGIPCEEQLCGH